MQGLKLSFRCRYVWYWYAEEYRMIILPQGSMEDETTTIRTQIAGGKENMNSQVSNTGFYATKTVYKNTFFNCLAVSNKLKQVN